MINEIAVVIGRSREQMNSLAFTLISALGCFPPRANGLVIIVLSLWCSAAELCPCFLCFCFFLFLCHAICCKTNYTLRTNTIDLELKSYLCFQWLNIHKLVEKLLFWCYAGKERFYCIWDHLAVSIFHWKPDGSGNEPKQLYHCNSIKCFGCIWP